MLVNDDPALWCEKADELLNRADDFRFCISPIVIEEISEAVTEIRRIIEDRISDVNPRVLPEEEEVGLLTRSYIEKGAFTYNQYFDAMHVAYASVNDLDILTSFNYKHIVRYNIKNIVKSVNILEGFHTPDIISPLQL